MVSDSCRHVHNKGSGCRVVFRVGGPRPLVGLGLQPTGWVPGSTAGWRAATRPLRAGRSLQQDSIDGTLICMHACMTGGAGRQKPPPLQQALRPVLAGSAEARPRAPAPAAAGWCWWHLSPVPRQPSAPPRSPPTSHSPAASPPAPSAPPAGFGKEAGRGVGAPPGQPDTKGCWVRSCPGRQSTGAAG